MALGENLHLAEAEMLGRGSVCLIFSGLWGSFGGTRTACLCSHRGVGWEAWKVESVCPRLFLLHKILTGVLCIITVLLGTQRREGGRE